MPRKYLLYLALLVILVLGILHYFASILYLYWSVWWFDYMMHFLAGFGGTLAALWGLRSTGATFRASILAFIILMSVGTAWEFFEYVYDISVATEGYAQDTFHDLLMDALGAGLAIVITRAKQEPS